jgi:hypothetical protein
MRSRDRSAGMRRGALRPSPVPTVNKTRAQTHTLASPEGPLGHWNCSRCSRSQPARRKTESVQPRPSCAATRKLGLLMQTQSTACPHRHNPALPICSMSFSRRFKPCGGIRRKIRPVRGRFGRALFQQETKQTASSVFGCDPSGEIVQLGRFSDDRDAILFRLVCRLRSVCLRFCRPSAKSCAFSTCSRNRSNSRS